MQDNKAIDWKDLNVRIKAKRKFLYWFVPLTFVCTLVLTFSIPTYYVCTTSLSTEDMHSSDPNRSLTLNRPENYDLGFVAMDYSIVPEDYDEVIQSTAFLCKILQTPVATADTCFSGTYYEYLATQQRYSWYTRFSRFIHGKKQPQAGEPLPTPDPFRPMGVANEAITTARNSINFSIDHRTKLITLSVKGQDPLVAALVTQAVSDALNQFASDYFLGKTKHLYLHLQSQIEQTTADYELALRQGDNMRASMLRDACYAFERQAILLNAQMQNHQLFTTLNNVTVPDSAAGPRHLRIAICATILILILVLLCICRHDLLTVLTTPMQE